MNFNSVCIFIPLFSKHLSGFMPDEEGVLLPHSKLFQLKRIKFNRLKLIKSKLILFYII